MRSLPYFLWGSHKRGLRLDDHRLGLRINPYGVRIEVEYQNKGRRNYSLY